MSDETKKKPFVYAAGGVEFSDIVVRELLQDHSRSKISVELTADTPAGTVLELTEDAWAKASAGTGKLGILTADAYGRTGKQEVGIVDRDAVAVASAILIDGGLLETATKTFESQGIKLI